MVTGGSPGWFSCAMNAEYTSTQSRLRVPWPVSAWAQSAWERCTKATSPKVGFAAHLRGQLAQVPDHPAWLIAITSSSHGSCPPDPTTHARPHAHLILCVCARARMCGSWYAMADGQDGHQRSRSWSPLLQTRVAAWCVQDRVSLPRAVMLKPRHHTISTRPDGRLLTMQNEDRRAFTGTLARC